MKNITYIINGILAVAIIILFILYFNLNKNNTSSNNDQPSNKVGNDSLGYRLPIAYVNVDSLLLKYNYAKDGSNALIKKENNSSSILNNKQKQLENAYADFQKKVQMNAFLSQERAQQESLQIQKLESDLRDLAQRLQNEYLLEQSKLNSRIVDSVRLCLKEYNKNGKYELILSNTGLDNILLAKDNYDITNEIVAILNSRYKAESTK